MMSLVAKFPILEIKKVMRNIISMLATLLLASCSPDAALVEENESLKVRLEELTGATDEIRAMAEVAAEEAQRQASLAQEAMEEAEKQASLAQTSMKEAIKQRELMKETLRKLKDCQ